MLDKSKPPSSDQCPYKKATGDTDAPREESLVNMETETRDIATSHEIPRIAGYHWKLEWARKEPLHETSEGKGPC